MARARGTATAKPTISGSGFWLIAAFAATVAVTATAGQQHRLFEAATEHWWVPLAMFFAWGLVGRLLGGLLRLAGRDSMPTWVFRLNGWTPATLAGGILGAFAWLGAERPHDPLHVLLATLGMAALVGGAWIIMVDVPRLGLWRLSRRPRPRFLAVATLAVPAGLVVLGLVVYHHVEGSLGRELPEAAIGGLLIVLASAGVLTLLVELPLALLARSASGRAGVAGLLSHLGAARQRAGRTIGPPDPAASGPKPQRPNAREAHGTVATAPTVVRRQ